jgi:hypothetical protein
VRVGQNEVTPRISQSGGTLSGTASFVVRQGGAEVSSSSLGMTFNGTRPAPSTSTTTSFTFPA